MSIFNSITNLFSRKETLADLGKDELLRERIRLGQTEKELVKKIDTIEADKKTLFAQGTNESSGRSQLIIARKIKELDVQARNYDKSLAVISQQTRTINGLVQLKDNEKLLEQSGLSKMIARMDLSELQGYVSQASVDGEFKMEKLNQILSVVEGSDTLPGADNKEDADILEIMNQMQRAKELETDPGALDATFREMDKTLKKDREF